MQTYLALQEKGLITWSSQGSQDLVDYICTKSHNCKWALDSSL